MAEDRKPGGFGKKPFKKSFGKKPFGDRGPRREGGSGPRREGGGFGGKRSFGDRGSRPGGFKKFGDRDRPSRDRQERPDADRPRTFPTPLPEGAPRPERDAGDRPFRKKPFGDRGGFGDRGPRREGGPRDRGGFGGRREGGFNKFGGGDRGDRRGGYGRSEGRDGNRDDRYRGMYGKPMSDEQREWKKKRSYRPDPGFVPDQGPEAPAHASDADTAADTAARPHLAENELRYHGKNACLALLKSRPQDIVRAYILREKAEELSSLIEFCAKNHLAYHLVGAGDLERLSDSIHHQGVVIIARAKRFFKEEIFFKELGAHRTLVVYLDGVANPHNLGAILRTAAHFGVKWVCVPKDEITKISPALYRTAEGGAETVNLVRVEDTEKFLDRLRGTGFQLYAFEPGEKAIPLFETRLNEKSVFVFGAEVEGLSGLVKTIVETKVTIPGTGNVESLNVSVAAAVAMAEFERQGQAPRAVRIVKSRS